MRNINWDIVTPVLWTGAAGMVVGALALTYVFGFMSPSTAEKMAQAKSENAVIAALAPSCAEDFQALPDAQQRMAQLVANRGSYTLKDVFPESLVTLPGRSYIDYDLVRECAKLLTASAKSASS